MVFEALPQSDPLTDPLDDVGHAHPEPPTGRHGVEAR
jgi:hypothetical protein